MAKRYDAQIYRNGPIESVVLTADYNALAAELAVSKERERRAQSQAEQILTAKKALEAALTPSAETKAAYIAEHQIEVEMLDEDGYSCTEMVTIPWTTTKDIMAMILKRADTGVK